jgi:hypothetical protein
LVLNQALPATSSLASFDPASMLARSISNSALAAAGLAGSKASLLRKLVNFPSTGTFICFDTKLRELCAGWNWLNSMARAGRAAASTQRARLSRV